MILIKLIFFLKDNHQILRRNSKPIKINNLGNMSINSKKYKIII